MPQLMGRWAEIDPVAAAEFSLTQGNWQMRNSALNGVLGTWALTDPNAAMAWVAHLPAGSQRSNGIYNLVTTLARSDPSTALRFAANFPNDARTNYAYRAIFSEWADVNPTAAAARSARAAPRARIGIGRWRPRFHAGRRPIRSGALAWAQAIAEPNQRNAAVSNTLSAWAGVDAGAVSTYLQTMPPGQQKNWALEHGRATTRVARPGVRRASWSNRSRRAHRACRPCKTSSGYGRIPIPPQLGNTRRRCRRANRARMRSRTWLEPGRATISPAPSPGPGNWALRTAGPSVAWPRPISSGNGANRSAGGRGVLGQERAECRRILR